VTVILIGANYHNLSLVELEKLESAAELIRNNLFNDKSDQHGIDGAVVVSTCNRFEIYLDSDDVSGASNYAREVIKSAVGFSDQFLNENLIQLIDSAAINHLFRVTSGLDSMVVGEVEIAGQIKRSLSDTHELGHTSRITEALFQRASLVSKKVATETGLGAAGRSLISTALI
jgi:glutamyl-tRNA reductase